MGAGDAGLMGLVGQLVRVTSKGSDDEWPVWRVIDFDPYHAWICLETPDERNRWHPLTRWVPLDTLSEISPEPADADDAINGHEDRARNCNEHDAVKCIGGDDGVEFDPFAAIDKEKVVEVDEDDS